MPKDLSSLVADVYDLFGPNRHEPSEKNLEAFAENLKALMRRRLAGKSDEPRTTLRFSNLGKPDRQLWYDEHPDESQPAETLSPKTEFKFLYGDLIEQLLLFLVKESGHDVQSEQGTVEVDGVRGSLDAVIDGVTVDVKSASPMSFKKFESGRLREDDPFGYIGQISGYASETTPESGGAFLVADKVHGDISLMRVPPDTVAQFRPKPRIEHLKSVLSRPDPPERCYPDVPEGKSGNRKLSVNCSYCRHKFRCWSDVNGGVGLRTFFYGKGPVFLTHVEKEPRVSEDVG